MADKSKLVTEFLFNTCRRQPTTHDILVSTVAVDQTECTTDDKDADYDWLISGSSAELYVKPMLTCIGDIDVMYYRNNVLAIPAGYPAPRELPAEFNNRVQVYEMIDSQCRGYVYLMLRYLLKETTEDGEYKAELDLNSNKVVLGREVNGDSTVEIHGPAVNERFPEIGMSRDLVSCVPCLSWPTQAADWPTRERNYGWPDSATVDRVVSNGCDAVMTTHPVCRHDLWITSRQCRLSFSRAEIVLLNSWMPVQQIVYHMMRIYVKTKKLADVVVDQSGTKALSNYHVKTLVMWSAERKPRHWWTDDMNVVRISAELLQTLGVWLTGGNCRHYFIDKCNLVESALDVEIASRQLGLLVDEAHLSAWFVDNYIKKCAQLCPADISGLFDDVAACYEPEQLWHTVSMVVDWRRNAAPCDFWSAFVFAEQMISHVVCQDKIPLTGRLCVHRMKQLAAVDSRLLIYFTGIAFLYCSRSILRHGLTYHLMDALFAIILREQFSNSRRNSNRLGSIAALRHAVKLMKDVANNSPSTVTVQLTALIEVELAKAYMYRALKRKDSEYDSIYCLANVYLAVLYYITGENQSVIDHCTLVMRSQDHSQCSSHVTLVPKIGDDFESLFGLVMFYQYVRLAAFNMHQTQTEMACCAELLANCIRSRCLPGNKRPQLSTTLPYDENLHIIRSGKYIHDMKQASIAEVPPYTSAILTEQKHINKTLIYRRQQPTIDSAELNTSKLAELLQLSAMEHLTRFRQCEATDFGSVVNIVTTDVAAMYAYKRGHYQRCLWYCTRNVHKLFGGDEVHHELSPCPPYAHLLDDDIVSLIALAVIAYCQHDGADIYCIKITQLTLSLYLMTQCHLKLRHSAAQRAQTLDHIDAAKKYSHSVGHSTNSH